MASSEASCSVNRRLNRPGSASYFSKAFPFHAGQPEPAAYRAPFPAARCAASICELFITMSFQIARAVAARPPGARARRIIRRPTPIQTQAIPTLLKGRDLLGIAQTGTGKTAAFMLPSIDRLAAARRVPRPASCRMLVLAPTRELASQIAESAARLWPASPRLSVTTAFGGVPIGKQRRALERGVDILVATPGRLIDLVEQRYLTPARGRDPRPRRGRPDARPRLHPRAQARS